MQLKIGRLYTEATCAEEGEKSGICSRCGDTMQEAIPKLEHTLGEWVVSKNPTPSEAGEKTQSCTVCAVQYAAK